MSRNTSDSKHGREDADTSKWNGARQANGELEIGALWSKSLRYAASSKGENRMALIPRELRARCRDIGGGCALTRRAFSLRVGGAYYRIVPSQYGGENERRVCVLPRAPTAYRARKRAAERTARARARSTWSRHRRSLSHLVAATASSYSGDLCANIGLERCLRSARLSKNKLTLG